MVKTDSPAPAAAPPRAILLFPAGESVITATVDGEPQTRRVVADAAAAGRLQADLAGMLAGAAAGERPRPCLYFDHTPGPAAAYPARIYWQEGRGIMLELAEWTAAGQAALTGHNYAYLSPAFNLSRTDGRIEGLLTDGVEVASLVNDPAFATMPEIMRVAAARASELPPGTDALNRTEKFSPRKDLAKKSPSHQNKNRKTATAMNDTLRQIKELLHLDPAAEPEALYAAIEDLLIASGEAEDQHKPLPTDKEPEEDVTCACEKRRRVRASAPADEDKEKDAPADEPDATPQDAPKPPAPEKPQPQDAAKDARIRELKAKLADAMSEAAANFVQTLIQNGTIAPKDKERIAAARALYVAAPKQARIYFARPAGEAALGQSVLAAHPAAASLATSQTLEDMIAADFNH